MNGSDRENLKELLARFMNAVEAGRAAQDIVSGDELLRSHPAPRPDEDVIAGLKAVVSAVVRRRQRITLKRRIFAVAAVAAALVAVSALAIKFFENRPVKETSVRIAFVIPGRIWESSDITTDDADIAVLSAEISTIENELYGINPSDSAANGSAVDDLEMELIGISGDFWKG